MESMKRKRSCCGRSRWCAGAPGEEHIPNGLVAFSVKPPAAHDLSQLLADIEQILEKGGDAEELPMSEEVKNYATHLQKHLNKVSLGAQVSRDALNALGSWHWVGAGLVLIAMSMDMALKTHDNKQQCIDIMEDSLDIWKKVMKPVLHTNGLASDFMSESISIIIEGYLYCKDLVNTRTWKRFLCASCHEKELKMWIMKQENFLLKANAVMSADLIQKLSPAPPAITVTIASILVGIEGRKVDVMKLLKPEDKEETRVVVLHGLGGVGKSTLAEAVYKQVSVSKERRRCRIEVGENPSKEHITRLQRQMVENFTGENLMMEKDPEIIRDKLRQVLLSAAREPVLMYMDNVFQSEDLEELLSLDCELITLPKGSRLLVTTRDVSVCTNIFQRNQSFKLKQYMVKVLNDKDAKKLFFLHAFGQEDPSSKVLGMYDEGLIEEMVSSHCGNLPLALRVLGRSLFNTSLHSWRTKYNDLKLFEKLDQGKRVINVLKSSYETLNPETQIAFLMACVCFYDVHYADFKKIVESILPQASTLRLIEVGLLARDVVPRWTSMGVQVKIHDLVKNLGYQLAAARKYTPAKRPTCKQDFLDLDDESLSEIKWLRVPPLEDGIEAEFLEKCKGVEIIYLDTHVKGHIVNPPLQLKVVCTTSSLMAELDKLKKLAVLMVGGDDPLQEFPVAACPSAGRLQVLFGFGGLKIPQSAIDCHKKVLRKFSCTQIAELSPYFCEAMTKLQELSLWKFEGASLPIEMGSLTSLETLAVSSTTIEELPQSLAHLKQLQHLQLELRNLKEMTEGMLGGMKELAWLQLWNLERVTYLPLQEIGQLAALEDLEIILPCVQRLTDDGGTFLKLEKLKRLYLWCESVSSLEGVQLSCPSLECVILVMEKLKELPSKFLNGTSNLQSLYLANCDSLEELPAEAEMLGAIETLAIVQCPALKAIPEEWIKSVESLALVGCRGMVKLPTELDDHKAGSMRFLACDKQLLPPQFLPLPMVLPYTPGDRQTLQQLHSFFRESFFLVSSVMNI